MKQFEDLSGKTFGIWEVIEFDHMNWQGVNRKHGMSYYRCRCKKCGRVLLKARSNLLQGTCKYHQGKCIKEK